MNFTGIAGKLPAAGWVGHVQQLFNLVPPSLPTLKR
jgi:hypothetical protein